uniref:Transposase n=1 Tax=Enterobacter cloacae TaxID=550 RepID=A0A0N7C3W7_ENTCL|nr:hypothetical protein [Enterobacter cloacae]AKJ21423.1 Transposase [Enterobacter cloacae]
MSWAQRAQAGLFYSTITTCAHCGGAVRIVASIEDPKAIRAILAHVEKHGALEQAHYRPAARAPPPRRVMRRAGHTAGSQARVRSDAATTPQGCARPLCRDSARNGYALSRLRGPAMSKTHA